MSGASGSPAELELRRTLRHVRGFTYVVGATALFILAGLALLNLLAYVELLEIAEGNRANGRAIRECTTPAEEDPEWNGRDPSGRCFEASQKRTAVVVATIVAEGDRRTCERLQQAFDQIVVLDPPVDLACPSAPGGSP